VKIFLCILSFLWIPSSCKKPIERMETERQFTYLALGDSYTIGEAVLRNESFPFQLAEALYTEKIQLKEPKVIAKTGWTTDELTAAIHDAELKETFDLVTLLIGVNNQYRGYSKVVYEKEFTELLLTAIKFAKDQPGHVIVVSIPDWGVTPFAKDRAADPALIASEIDEFNAINKRIGLEFKVDYVDITPYSRTAATNSSLIAADGLHPSEAMYTGWVKELLPIAKSIFQSVGR